LRGRFHFQKLSLIASWCGCRWGYPTAEQEQEILRRRRERGQDEPTLQKIVDAQELTAMRQTLETIFMHPDIERYIVELVQATRADGRVLVGASPRGSLALLKLSRARAALEGRDYVIPDDVKSVAHEALAHRLILQPELWMKRLSERDIVSEILERVPVPKVE
jgi:MoxR-like ATPase